jgi:hypothetical protein
MDVNLTNNGIMMNNGSVISTDVTVDIISDGSVRVSYTDEYGYDRTDIRSTTDSGISLMRNSDRIINSVLSKNDDWYVFWKIEGRSNSY